MNTSWVRNPLYLAAGMVWTGWLAIGVWSWLMLYRRQLHPQVWPPVVLAAMSAIGFFLLAGGVVRALVKRTGRGQSLAAFCCGTIPIWLFAAHAGYVHVITVQRIVKINRITLPLLPIGTACAQLEVSLRYSHRTDGKHVVMYHHSMEDAAELVAKADQFIAGLIKQFGRSEPVKVIWVRGRALGRQYCSFGAFALSDVYKGEQFSQIDRHELAHAVIGHYMEPGSRPPMLLVEGWAEAASAEPDELLERAAKELDWGPSLAELVGPDWCWIDNGPVYSQGGPFVDLLLQQFGAEKFLQLYVTCTPRTFDADCRRILGVGLSELQQLHEQRITDWVQSHSVPEQLRHLVLEEGVDREEWLGFVAEYAAALVQTPPPHNVELQATITIQTPQHTQEKSVRVASLPDRQFYVSDEELLAITDSVSYHLYRPLGEDRWQLSPPWAPVPVLNRWLLQFEFASRLQDAWRTASVWPTLRPQSGPPPTVFEFRREPDSTVHIGLQYRSKPDDGEDVGDISTTVCLVLLPEVNWQLESSRSEHKNLESAAHSQYVYEQQDGELTYWSCYTEQTVQHAPTTSSKHEIRVHRPPRISEADFSLTTYGINRPSAQSLKIVGWPIYACLAMALVQSAIGVPLVWRTGNIHLRRQ